MIKNKRIRGSCRISFLARKEEMSKMYEQGYPLISIFEKYQEKLNISYGSFAKYARTHFPKPAWKVIPESEPEISEEERLYHEQMATEDMLNLCDKLVTTFIERQDWLPEKYGRLAGFVKGFAASER